MDERLMTVVETPAFIIDAKRLLSDDERNALILYIAAHPDEGDVLVGTGGARKLRWKRNGKGKSGGYRVITFFHDLDMPVFLLAIFGKNERANLLQAERNALHALLKKIVKEYEARRKR